MFNINLPHIFKKKVNPRFILILLTGGFLILGAWSYFQLHPIKFEVKMPARGVVTAQKVSPEVKNFGIVINKIDIIVPIIGGVDGTDKAIYNEALKKGVAHYKGTFLPGQGSNIFIFGHSSVSIGVGPYAKIFAKLNDLIKDDEIVVYYQKKQFRYRVFEKQIVPKDAISVLEPTPNEQLTLMTCWPIGSNEKRLIVKASLFE